jgi:hypothetical protein
MLLSSALALSVVATVGAIEGAAMLYVLYRADARGEADATF